MKLLGSVFVVLFAAIVATVVFHLTHGIAHPLHAQLLNDESVMGAGAAWEILSGFNTAPGATLTAWTMGAGDSLTMRYSPDNTKMVRLMTAWFTNKAAGAFQITAPTMHDNVRALHGQVVTANPLQLMPRGVPQRLRPQDTLSVLQSGSAVGGAIEQGSVMIYYDDLPGIAARFIDTPTLMRRGVNIIGVKNTLALGVTGGYSGSQAINTTDDLFKANTDYALVGYLTDTLCGSIGWKGADTGNLRVGGPGHNTQKQVTGDWFKRLGEEFGLPMIPVFNSAGKGAIFIDGTQDDGGADPIVTSLFVELAPGQ